MLKPVDIRAQQDKGTIQLKVLGPGSETQHNFFFNIGALRTNQSKYEMLWLEKGSQYPHISFG